MTRVVVVAALVIGLLSAMASSAVAGVSLSAGAARSHAAAALEERYGLSWREAGRPAKGLSPKRRQSASKVRLSYHLATTVEKEGTCPSPEAAPSECTPPEAQQETYSGIVIVWRPPAEPRHIRARVIQKSSRIAPCTLAC